MFVLLVAQSPQSALRHTVVQPPHGEERVEPLTTDVFSQDPLGLLQRGHQAAHWGLKRLTFI